MRVQIVPEEATTSFRPEGYSYRRDLSPHHSAPIVRGQKIDVEKFNRKINFGMWRHEVMDALIQIALYVVLKNKRHLYDEET